MRTALVGMGVAGAVLGLALGGCVVGKSPVVGEEAGGAAATGGSGGTGASQTAGRSGAATGGDPGDQEGSTTAWMGLVRPGVTLDDPTICMPRPLPIDAEGNPECKLYAVVPGTQSNGSCRCASASQRPASEEATAAILDLFARELACDFESTPACSELCACEVPLAEGEDKTTCQNDAELSGGEGWCYVAPEAGVGSPHLVTECGQRPWRVRYLETGIVADDFAVLACAGSQEVPPGGYVDPKPLGAPCLPDDERLPDFYGFSPYEVSVDANAGCNSGVCVVNHLQGRVSCPYGQTEDESQTDPKCFIPGTELAVTVPVDPQHVESRAARAAICSCRCAGDGPGPFCACPSDMQCSPLVEHLGLPTDQTLAGSYCIPRGSAWEPGPRSADYCNRSLANCGDPDPY